ncbi:MAG: glycoside hydrolase family 2 protein [Nakamurella sp.]
MVSWSPEADPDGSEPRPQLRRARHFDLTGHWEFEFDDADLGADDRWWKGDHQLATSITVPYPPESELSGVADREPHSILWYRKEISLPSLSAGERMVLHFGAVDYRCQVWVDGVLVAQHEGGHTRFSADITTALADRATHIVVVRVEDGVTDPQQPRGKQDWQPRPHAIWYDRTSGIWQPVWIEVVPQQHIRSLSWSCDLAAGTVELTLRLARPPTEPLGVEVELAIRGQLLAAQSVRSGSQRVRLLIDLPQLRHGQDLGRLLWSPENPNIVDARITAGSDQVASYLGLRSCGFRDGRFLLNGKPYYLRMVLGQGFWPQSHLAAPDSAALRAEVEAIRALGFTGVRVHQKIEDPRFLGWCDRLGLLVWEEMPSGYEFGTDLIRRITSEWSEAIERDASHPCIVAWVPLNESWGVPDIPDRADQQQLANALYHLTRALDPSRPVVSNDGWEHTVSDLWTVHDYIPDGASIRQRYGDPAAVARTLTGAGPGRRKVLLIDGDDRGQPVLLSEIGGLSLHPGDGAEWFGYGVVGSTDELTARLRELIAAVLDCPDVGGFCYTQLTDTQQEANGLLTAGRGPKISPDVVRDIMSQPAAAIPAETVDQHRRAARQRR